jgi:hypothetical protein
MPSKEICRDGVGSNDTFQGSDTDYEVSSLFPRPSSVNSPRKSNLRIEQKALL